MPEAQHFSWVLERVEVHISVRCRGLDRESSERRMVVMADMAAYW